MDSATNINNASVSSSSFDIEKWKKQFNPVFLYKENYSLLTIDLYCKATKKYKNVLGNHHKNYIFISKNGEVSAYYSQKESHSSQKMSLNFLKTPFFINYFRRSELSRSQYEKFKKKILEIDNIENLSNKQIYKLFSEYSKIYTKLVAYFRSSRPEFSDYFIELIKKSLTNLGPLKLDLEKSILYLTTPFDENNPIYSEQKDWLMLLKGRSYKKKKIINHINKYPWLFTNTYSVNQVLKFLSIKYNKDKKRVKQTENGLKNIEKQKNESIEYKNHLFKFDKSGHLKKLSKIIQRQATERLLIKTSLMGIDYVFKDLLKLLANLTRLNISKFVNSYMLDDIKELLLENKILPRLETVNRQRNYILLVENSKKTFFSGFMALKIAKKFIGEETNDDINGLVAYKGLVRGRVKIINTKNIKMLKETVTGFKRGNILVTSMTQPNIISIIDKAAAIVTDQGGIISHAAIISREMKKPCIVGTKNSTRILRNGDLIEVDANNGRVRILKRK